MTTGRGEAGDLSAGDEQAGEASRRALKGEAVRSFLWASLSLLGNRIVVFVTTLLLARLLTPDDFGTVAAALVLISFLNLVLDLGLGAALVQQQSSGYGPRAETAFTVHLGLSVASATLLLAAAPVIADALGIANSVDVVRILALSVPLRALGQTHDALLRRDLQFRARTIVGVGRAVLRLAVSVVLAVGGAGVWAIVAGYLVSELAATVALWACVPFRPRLRLSRTHLSTLIRFGGWVTAFQLISALLSSSDELVVSRQLGATALGFYVVAFRLPELVVQDLLATFSQVAFPVLSRARSMSVAQLRQTVLRSLTLVTLFGFCTGVGLAVTAPDAVPILFGPGWEPSVAPMALLALAAGVGSVGYGVGDAYLAIGKPMIRFWILAGITGPTVVGYVVAAPHGITAVAAVQLGVSIVFALVQLVVANRLVGITARAAIDALRGPVGAMAGILITTLPILEVVAPGAGRLVLLVVAGTTGAVAGGMLLDPRLPRVMRDLAAAVRIRGRRPAPA